MNCNLSSRSSDSRDLLPASLPRLESLIRRYPLSLPPMAYHTNTQQQPYTDPSDAFNPYVAHTPHQTYDQGGAPTYNYGDGGAHRYTDDDQAYNPHSPVAAAGPAAGVRQRDSMGSQFDNETEDNHARSRGIEEKSFKTYRYDGQGGLWTRGGISIQVEYPSICR